MKQSFLSILENKYYYAVSRYFWHLVIAVGILGIGIGILVYVWTLVPPTKRTVVRQTPPPKPSYPSLREVTLQDILRALPVKKEVIEVPTPPVHKRKEVYEPENYHEEQEVVTIDPAALAAFNRSLGQTKQLIPVETNKTFWQDSYIKKFNSKRDEKMYKKTHNPNLYKLVLKHAGFKNRFIAFTDRKHIKSYYEKARLLDSYNSFVEHIDSTNRKIFFNDIAFQLPVRNLGINEIDRRLNAISTPVSKVRSYKQLTLFNKLWKFIKYNPNDGVALINYISGFIEKIPENVRTEFIENVFHEYSANYNNNLSGLKETTNHFVDKISQLEPSRVPIALKTYYRLYRENNIEHVLEIEKINREYEKTLANIEDQYHADLSQAESEYNHAIYRKKDLKQYSYIGIAAGFVGLLLFSLVLLILSMIRNINRLTEAMYEQNHNFQNQLNQVLTSEDKKSVHHKQDTDTKDNTK